MTRFFSLLHLALGLILVVLLGSSASRGQEVPDASQPLVVVLSSSRSTPYMEVVEGFRERLGNEFGQAKIEAFFLGQDPEENRVILTEIGEKQPDLLFALGSRATREMQERHPDRPLVVTMVLNEKMMQEHEQTTGVYLTFPVQVHLRWLRRILPEARRIYLLYNPAENSEVIRELRQEGEMLGLEVSGLQVDGVTQLPSALKFMGRKADVLLGLPDQTVYSSKTAKAVLLSAFRDRIAFVGLSRYWVKAGALYALDWDYHDLGRQSAEMGGRILGGVEVSRISPAPPDVVHYVINLRTANHLRIAIDPVIVEEAAEVFR